MAAAIKKRPFTSLAHLMLIVALVATSCGIPEDDNAEIIPDRALPIELVGGPILPPSEAGEGAQERFIFMVDEDDILVPVKRVSFPNPDAIMEQLLGNTTPAEREQGISSAIPRDTGFNPSNGVQDGIVFIDLTAGSLLGLSRQDREVAFAQIVSSLAGLPAIEAVNFSIDGEFISVQTSDGTTTPGQAVSPRDFSTHQRIQIGFEEPEVSAAPEPEPTPTPVIVDTRSELAVWMFDADGRLRRVSRRIELSPENIMTSLLEGPTIPESEIGFTTALTPEAVVFAPDVDETLQTAFVDLTPVSLPPLAGDQKLRAVAQIVYTLTELSEISGVVISIDGVRQAMPTDAGIVPASTILRREDFVALAPVIVGLDQPGRVTDAEESGQQTGNSDEAGETTGSGEPNEAGEPAQDGESGTDATSEGSTAPTPAPTPTPSPTPTPTPTPTPSPTPTPDP